MTQESIPLGGELLDKVTLNEDLSAGECDPLVGTNNSLIPCLATTPSFLPSFDRGGGKFDHEGVVTIQIFLTSVIEQSSAGSAE